LAETSLALSGLTEQFIADHGGEVLSAPGEVRCHWTAI
jgi:hypothetical protein